MVSLFLFAFRRASITIDSVIVVTFLIKNDSISAVINTFTVLENITFFTNALVVNGIHLEIFGRITGSTYRSILE
jgi:hypothetical protein